MKRKEVEDVMGGANAWENVDKADGMFEELRVVEVAVWKSIWSTEMW